MNGAVQTAIITGAVSGGLGLGSVPWLILLYRGKLVTPAARSEQPGAVPVTIRRHALKDEVTGQFRPDPAREAERQRKAAARAARAAAGQNGAGQ